jgi:hypothetical protein
LLAAELSAARQARSGDGPEQRVSSAEQAVSDAQPVPAAAAANEDGQAYLESVKQAQAELDGLMRGSEGAGGDNDVAGSVAQPQQETLTPPSELLDDMPPLERFPEGSLAVEEAPTSSPAAEGGVASTGTIAAVDVCDVILDELD